MINSGKLMNRGGGIKHSLLITGATLSVLSPAILMTEPAQAAGKIIVNHDEWTLSNFGFTNAPDAGTFATNVASWFTGGGSGTFHAYSNNFGLTQSSLANTLIGAGHTWTTGTSITFDLPTLLTYDGIFLGGDAVNNTVLINYINAGGNVYLMSGTGVGGAVNEANQWNTFLNAFGLSFAQTYNGVVGNQAISSSHPIFTGVNTLYQNNGQSISDLALLDPTQQILVNHPTEGLYAVYDMAAIPEPLTILGVGTAVGFGTAFKRKLAKKQKQNDANNS